MPEFVLTLLENPYAGVALYQALIAWPLVRIVRRSGFPASWGWVGLVPFLGPLLVLMLLGHRRWPHEPPPPPPPVRKARRP